MNCQSFESVVNDLAREQLIEATLRNEALQHSDACSACAARLSEERSLSVNLRALAVEMNSLGAPGRVESFLLTAFNERQLARQARPKRWNYFGLAAAAVLLMAFVIGVAAWNLKFPSTTQVDDVVASKPVVDAPLTVAPSSKEPQPSATEKPERDADRKTRRIVKPGPGRVGRLRPATAQTESVAALSDTEVTTDFMPIGYVNSASLQDGGSVVRVELPRSTIVSLGFAMNMDRYGERVKADVLMGADGLARAIRFVQ